MDKDKLGKKNAFLKKVQKTFKKGPKDASDTTASDSVAKGGSSVVDGVKKNRTDGAVLSMKKAFFGKPQQKHEPGTSGIMSPTRITPHGTIGEDVRYGVPIVEGTGGETPAGPSQKGLGALCTFAKTGTQTVGNVGESVVDGAKTGTQVVGNVGGSVVGGAETGIQAVGNVGSSVVGGEGAVGGAVGDDAKTGMKAVGNVGTGVLGGAKTGAQSVRTVGGSVLGGSKDVGGSLLHGAKTGAEAVANVGRTAVGTVVDGTKKAGSTVAGTVGRVDTKAGAVGNITETAKDATDVTGDAVDDTGIEAKMREVTSSPVVTTPETVLTDTSASTGTGTTPTATVLGGVKATGTSLTGAAEGIVGGAQDAGSLLTGMFGGAGTKVGGKDMVCELPESDISIHSNSNITTAQIAPRDADTVSSLKGNKCVVSGLKDKVPSAPKEAGGAVLGTAALVGGRIMGMKKAVTPKSSKANIPDVPDVPIPGMETDSITDNDKARIIKETVPTPVSPAPVVSERSADFAAVKEKFRAKTDTEKVQPPPKVGPPMATRELPVINPNQPPAPDGTEVPIPVPTAVVATRGTSLAESGDLVEESESSQAAASAPSEGYEEEEEDLVNIMQAIIKAHKQLGERLDMLSHLI